MSRYGQRLKLSNTSTNLVSNFFGNQFVTVPTLATATE